MTQRKIRVLQFSKIINRNDFIDVLVRYSNKDQFEVFAAAWQMESNIEDPNYAADGIPFYNLNISTSLIGFINGAWKLGKILREKNIQILHTHHYYETIIGWIACFFHRRTKLVFGRHYHNEFYITAAGLKLKLYLAVERLINNYSSAIIVPSRVIKELLLEQGVAAEKIKVIHYAFDFSKDKYQALSFEDKLKGRAAMGWTGHYIIGNFSRHHPIKGQEYLLEAFARFVDKVPGAKLVMVGDGSLRKSLEKSVEEQGISDKVEFLGWRKDGSYLMNLCDVIVHSTLQEAFPQTMIEVMSLQVPLVITPVSGVVDIVINEENGYVVPFRSSEAIFERLSLLYSNEEQAAKVGKRAGVYVRDVLSLDKIIPQYETVYVDLID